MKKIKFFEDFKKFAFKGNVIDMAVGVIIGNVFGKIVTSLVNDIIMPPIGLLIGGVDFSDLKLVMKQAVDESPAVTLNYGAFIQNIINFLIVAIAVFACVKLLNTARDMSTKKEREAAALKAKQESEAKAKEPKAPTTEQLLTEICDLLSKNNSQ